MSTIGFPFDIVCSDGTLFSSLSIFIITPEPVKAQDWFDDLGEFLSEDLLILYGMQPFVTAGTYEYLGDENLNIGIGTTNPTQKLDEMALFSLLVE